MVKARGTVLGGATRFFELRSVKRLNVESRGSVNVLCVFTDKTADKTGVVLAIACVYGFPNFLNNLVNLRRVTCVSTLWFTMGPRMRAAKDCQGADGLGVRSFANDCGMCFAI